MINLIFRNHSESSIQSDDLLALGNLYGQFSFYVPGFRFMPAYERGAWDGKIHLVDLRSKTFPTGLLNQIESYLTDSNIEYTKEGFPESVSRETVEELEEFIKSHHYYSKGKEIFPREDQTEAIIRAIREKRCINICPTSFGKSLCIFIQALFHIEKLGSKVIIVVPSVNLVRQFKNDIIDYCTGPEGVRLPVTQEIYSGHSKTIEHDTDIVITTWQSIFKLDPSWINQFGCLILDEAHKGSANCIRKVFQDATEVAYRTGWTGSLKESSLVGLQAESLIGPIKVITDTATLMDKGIVADLSIECVRFQYDPDVVEDLSSYLEGKKSVTGSGKNVYNDEVKFLESSYSRNKTIIDMAGSIKKTGLLLYTHVAHGKTLYEYARHYYPERNVYRIDGSCVIRNDEKFNTYEELKSIIEKEEDAILICSFGVFSTGVSIKNIHYIFFTVPVKSYVRTIQSIGRGLRISDTKRKIILFDLIDDLCKKAKSRVKENYAYKHFKERFAMYNEQKFKYNMSTIRVHYVTPRDPL